MRFKINDIQDEGLAIDVPVTATWLKDMSPDLDAVPVEPGLRLAGRIERSGRDFLLHGHLRGEMTGACVRCLEPARIVLDQDMTVTFIERPADQVEEELEDVQVSTWAGDEIDISVALRDEIVLALPPNPVCRETCAGLCPVCGGNRNQKPCDCEERQRMASSKLGALKDFKLD